MLVSSSYLRESTMGQVQTNLTISVLGLDLPSPVASQFFQLGKSTEVLYFPVES